MSTQSGGSVIELFLEAARDVSVEDAAKRLGLKFTGRRHEHPQPCPHCGGTDTFAFNTVKNKWNCRAGDAGGNDGIGMAAHCEGLDLHRREGLLEACSVVLDRPVPSQAGTEDADAATARRSRLEERRRLNEARAAERAERQLDYRERERQKARSIYESAARVGRFGRLVLDYLEARGCGRIGASQWLRYASELAYWHGNDQRGRPSKLHSGPAMVAPFINADLEAIGCLITWIDLGCSPKCRPLLTDPATGEPLPIKKMRGSKKGGLIPLFGDPSAARWVGGEGIENGAAFACWESWREDTFYFAAGDLGNLAGPADPASRFAHPTLKKPDAKGALRPLMIAGPMPRPGQDPEDAMWVGEQVTELVLLADGDSERVVTAAAMARARARHARPGRAIPIVWPRPGCDFASMAAEAAKRVA
ncbi:P4 alpha zinc-binding domain-containing protein [Mesorhizobium sp. M1A.F.Ca.IN.022.07.1.1]|uniref:DUF7146 domain-containing protein n=1 Tax=Mesorhizobium sp. M1A.F.Ca.IN.022.07.1.1 TaxID=2496767 RepID=UPI000FCCC20E|nr:P4 alpha zinc-binding domain-containing protein [Mesorhizobium sp. M1A.F.Ca.IN.022.07.1.1]RUV97984.1 P4 alpha zinc-binding domain-containing protein [Mesorhizobium sp. M1A.F.Ca.IN.022.07.1.1]